MRAPLLLFALPFLGTLEALAVPLVGLSGDPTPDFATEYLLFSYTGNIGSNPERESAGTGYWTNAPLTNGASSSSNIHNTLTFTATGLAPGESLDLNKLSFDYVRTVLNGSNPKMNVYIDTGSGYGASVLLVEDQPSSSYQLDPQNIAFNLSLQDGDSVTFGFSFEDIHGLAQRTHLIDNVVLNGTFDLLSDTPGIDLNNNGVSDVWEYRFGAIHLVSDEASKQADFDGDGLSNLEEAMAGTNPFDARSNLEISVEPESATEARVKVATTSGKGYTLLGSESLNPDDSIPLHTQMEGTGGELAMVVDQGDFDQYFYRFELGDIDADSDRLSRWEEQHIDGFSDDANPSDDYQLAKDMVLSALESTITFSTTGNVLYERENLGTAITITRSSPLSNDLLGLETIQTYQLIDTTLVASNAASPGDYIITDEHGVELTDGVITLGTGEASATVYVQPVADNIIEADEQLTLSIPDKASFNLWIADAQSLPSADFIAISQAGHFLSQASMGGTPESISALANDIRDNGYLTACEAWIDDQLTQPRESTVTDDCYDHQTSYLLSNSVPSINIQNFELVWWGKVTQSKEQLRHRMAFSLSQIFVTSAAFWANSERNNVWQSYTKYYDKLMDDAFTTHRDLLGTISYDPFMGVYLSSAQNRKADAVTGTFPDENYAREVMQLFSCGVYSQDQNGNYLEDTGGNRLENYDNDDITELAKVFTGLSLTNENGALVNFDAPNSGRGTRYEHPMLMVQTHHETSGKTLLDGTVIPAGQTGDQDIATALDRLAVHPSTAPHLSRLLIKRLTSSNPSAAYIGRVTEAWRGEGTYGNGVHGDWVSILKAILLDPEARDAITYTVDGGSDAVTLSPAREISGRLKEPIIKWTQFYRFSQALSDEDDGLVRVRPKTKAAANDQTPDFGQIPMRAPSVFNYYDSDHSPSVGALADAEATFNEHLTSPESEILSPYVIKQFETFYGIANQDAPSSSFTYGSSIGNIPFTIHYNYLRYLYDKNETVGDFIDDINLWLCNGQISQELKDDLVALADANGGATRENYAKLLSILFNSSDFSVGY